MEAQPTSTLTAERWADTEYTQKKSLTCLSHCSLHQFKIHYLKLRMSATFYFIYCSGGGPGGVSEGSSVIDLSQIILSTNILTTLTFPHLRSQPSDKH